MMTKEESTKIVNSITPGQEFLYWAWLYTGSEKCNISSPLLVYTRTWIRQIKYIVMMTKEGSTKIVNFHDPRIRGSYVRADLISHYTCSEYALSYSPSIYSTLSAIVF